MENAVDALKIAFAIFVFVTAVTITFLLISQAKDTADVVLYYSDKTNFYEHTDSSDTDRVVGISEVISTLYRHYEESIGVTVVLGSNTYNFDDLNKPVDSFIKDNLLGYSDRNFIEKFVEVPVDGIYSTGEDGSQITLSSGLKKVYVTYVLQ